MKILHVNSYYNGSVFYKNLYEYQKKSGIDINVFVPVPSSYVDPEFDYGEYTRISKNHYKFDRLVFHLKHHKIYKDIVKKYDIGTYSVIHAHSLFSNGYVAMRLKKQFGIPYIVAVRNTDVSGYFKKAVHLRKIAIEIMKNAKKVIFISPSYKKLVLRNYIKKDEIDLIENKCEVIPNGIDSFWFNNIPNRSFSIIKM